MHKNASFRNFRFGSTKNFISGILRHKKTSFTNFRFGSLQKSHALDSKTQKFFMPLIPKHKKNS